MVRFRGMDAPFVVAGPGEGEKGLRCLGVGAATPSAPAPDSWVRASDLRASSTTRGSVRPLQVRMPVRGDGGVLGGGEGSGCAVWGYGTIRKLHDDSWVRATQLASVIDDCVALLYPRRMTGTHRLGWDNQASAATTIRV